MSSSILAGSYTTVSVLPAFGAAVRALESVGACWTPGDKLRAVARACRSLAQALRTATGSAAPDADALLPALILALAAARLPRPHTDAEFVSTFAAPEEREGEEFCCFTHFVSACAFLDQQADSTAGTMFCRFR